MPRRKRTKVAIIGGGCAAITAAFELTRPQHAGRYDVTVYQLGWRLGGKGASGRGPAGRIEEHGLHVWMGFYENAFRLVRECYDELNRDPERFPIAHWRDAFEPEPHVGVADRGANGQWVFRTAEFPPAEGLPGDHVPGGRSFTVTEYLLHAVVLLRTLVLDVQTRGVTEATAASSAGDDATNLSRNEIIERIRTGFRYGVLATAAGLTSAVGVLGVVFRSLSTFPQNVVLDLLERIAATAREQLETLVVGDDEIRYKWEIIDLVIAIMVGIVKEGLVYHPKGFDAINDYECLEWLRMNGASEKSTKSAFVRGLYDLAFAYGPDGPRPGLAAGQAIRGSLRMLFTYKGAMFWKMRVGMGDAVFAPFYEVLKRRGVKFEFFHRLENVGIAEDNDAPASAHVDRLDFVVQAKIKGGGEYDPLVDIAGLPSWPSKPDFAQLQNGAKLAREGRDFESDWDSTCATKKTLKVERDFDFVVLGIGIGAIPRTCAEILQRDERWRAMVEHVKTVETQAFQVWLAEPMEKLGWGGPPVTLSGYVHPFNTWADMRQTLPMEGWPVRPGGVAYFCNALADDPSLDRQHADYAKKRSAEVKSNAIRFLNEDVSRLWPGAEANGGFRWGLLVNADAGKVTGVEAFDSQLWKANVNSSDRYVLAAPGSLQYRISPLDATYDNLTIAGDWTDCGFNEGCAEAAVMSGRLAAHALSASPPLEDIVGYDHP